MKDILETIKHLNLILDTAEDILGKTLNEKRLEALELSLSLLSEGTELLSKQIIAYKTSNKGE